MGMGMSELFSRVNVPNAFATTLGIHSLPAHFTKLEKKLLQIVTGNTLGELFQHNQVEAEQVLLDDKLFRELVVQRSCAYVRESQKQHGGTLPPSVASYCGGRAPHLFSVSWLKIFVFSAFSAVKEMAGHHHTRAGDEDEDEDVLILGHVSTFDLSWHSSRGLLTNHTALDRRRFRGKS